MKTFAICLIAASAAITWSCSGDAPPAPGGSGTATTTTAATTTPTPYATLPTDQTGTGTGTPTPAPVTPSEMTLKAKCNATGKAWQYTNGATAGVCTNMTLIASCAETWIQTEFEKCNTGVGAIAVNGCSPISDTCKWQGVTPLKGQGYVIDQCGQEGKSIKLWMMKDNSSYLSTSCTQK